MQSTLKLSKFQLYSNLIPPVEEQVSVGDWEGRRGVNCALPHERHELAVSVTEHKEVEMFYERLPCFRDCASEPTEGKPVGKSVFYCCDNHPDLMANASITNANVPYTGILPSALSPGRLVTITGHIPPTAKHFTVELSCGTDADTDVALHLDVHLFPNSYVSRNSRISRKWGLEECAMGQRNRFRRDMDVHIDILTLRSAFYVAVNGRHFVKYRHRVRTSQVDTLRISGDLRVLSIKHGVETSYPAVCAVNHLPYDGIVGVGDEGIGSSSPVDAVIEGDDKDRVEGNIAVPFVGKLDDGLLSSGKELVIEGKVELLPCMLYVRLQAGQQHWPPPDVSLSIHARYIGTPSGDTELVLRSRANGVWGAATAVPKYPFKPGTRFRLAISVVGDTYQILVDGKLIAYVEHSLPTEKMALIDTVAIKGCVFVYNVYFKEQSSEVLL